MACAVWDGGWGRGLAWSVFDGFFTLDQIDNVPCLMVEFHPVALWRNVGRGQELDRRLDPLLAALIEV